ncbi:MAG: MraY family glycosyltransferase [Polyangiales bacterium]
MKGAAAGAALALVATAFVTPAVRHLAFRIGAVDLPGARRVHRRPVARLGGVGVLVGFFVALVVLGFTHSAAARLFFGEPLRFVGLLVGGALVCFLGVADDIRGVPPSQKLLVQAIAASIGYACGFRIEAISLPFLGVVELHFLAAPATVLWFVAIMNALNLIDGLDGLAGGIAFFACVSNLVVAYLNESPMVLVLAGTLAGAILGFLLYNFNPASIFLGDSGSLFLGFTLAAMSLLGSTIKSSTAVSILVPIIALGVPITDTLLAMVRRVLAKRPIFSADREHIHHRLLDLGIGHRSAVLVLYAMTIVLTVSAIAFAIGSGWEVGGALVLVAVVLFGMVRTSGRFAAAGVHGSAAAHLDAGAAQAIRVAAVDAVQAIGSATSDAEIASVLSRFAGATIVRAAVVESREVALERVSQPDDIDWNWLAFDLGGPDSPRCVRFELPHEVSPDWADVRLPLQLLALAIERKLASLAENP